MTDYISRETAIKAVGDYEKVKIAKGLVTPEKAVAVLSGLPSADVVEVVRCKDCRWWDKYGDYDNGYCMAAKHGYWSSHWEISIRRKYKGDFYCADAEPKGEQE